MPTAMPLPRMLSSLTERRLLFWPPARLTPTLRSSDQVSRVFTSISTTPLL